MGWALVITHPGTPTLVHTPGTLTLVPLSNVDVPNTPCPALRVIPHWGLARWRHRSGVHLRIWSTSWNMVNFMEYGQLYGLLTYFSYLTRRYDWNIDTSC